LITFVDEKGTEHSALVAYSVTNAVNGELSVKGTIYTNDKVLHGIGRGWRFRLDDEYYRITYAKPNDTGRQIEVEFDAVHQFFYDMSKSMVYTTLNGSKPFETYLQAIFSNSGYTYNLETTVESIRKENFGNKSRLSLFNDIIKAAGLEFSVRGHVVRILKRIGTDLSTIVRKDFNMNELKIEKDINSFVTYQRGLGAWKDDEDHSKGRYETLYESPLSAIYGRIEADPVVDERYKDTGKLLERLKENVDKSYKVSVEIDMEDLSQAGYRISHPNPGDYIMAINEILGFRQKVRIVSFTSEYDVGGNLISRKVVCNDIGTVQRATSEISHLSRTLTDSIEGSERALKTATRALVSADGKNTNYFGDVKPLDVPKGTLRKGDRLFLTVGDKKQLYFWNGAEWELEPTEFDHEKFDMEFNRKSQEIKKVIQENRQKAEEALRNAGASSLLSQEAKRIGLDSIAKLEVFKRQATSAQTALLGDLDVLKRTVTSEVNQASEYRRTTTEALSRMTGQMNGFATKSEVKQDIDVLTQTFAKMKVGGRNLWIKSQTVGAVIEKLPENHVTGQKECYRLENNSTLTFNIEPNFSSRLYQKVTYSAWIKFENVVQGQNSWNAFNCFKHYLFRKNSKTGIQNGPDYTTLGIYAGSSDWKYITFTYDYSENQNFDQLKTSLRFNLEGVTSGTAWVTGIKVEIGSVATDYSPALEDGEAELLVAKTEFKKTAEGLSTKIAAVESYVGQDGQRQEALRRYTREESARQATAVRELVTRDYVGKSAYQEDVRGIERRLEAITNPQNGSIATQIAKYKNAVDGRFADITSLIAGKANQTDFQRVRETSQLYERILGNTENGITDKVARMALTNQLFQIEVAKATKGGRNYIRGIKEMRVGSGSWDSGTFRGSGSGSVRTIEVSDSPVPGFNKALRIISSDPKGQIGVAQDGFEIMPGTYTMSVWIKGSAGQRVRLQNYWWSDDSTGISPEFILKDDKWTYLTFSSERKKAGKLSIGYVYLVNGAKGSYLDILAPQLEEGSIATSARPALEDTDEAIRTVQSQLAGSWAVQNLTSAGSIISQINATNNQILIEAEKIRLKGKTLLDELTAIQGYFKRLFVGEGAFATLNTDILRANSITADKLVMDMAMARMFVSSDIFTDTLAAKEAFINKLRSVVVTATLLEGFKGRIGGFQIGTHEKDSSVYWITGQNQFSVGMSNGSGHWSQTALWVNWGNNWGYPGDYAWFVKHTGQMYCYNRAEFWNTPIIHGDLKVTGHIFYNNENSGKSGYWIHSSKYSNFEPSNNYLYLYYSGSGYDWIPMNKEISDRRYKHNIEDSTVSGLDVVENLKTYSYRKEYDGKIEDIACGIMAQDVQKYAPEAFFENPDGAYSYNTFALVPYLIKAIQELNQKIEKLEKTA